MEEETNGKLPFLFLDVLVEKSDNNSFKTSLYHKQTFSAQYLNYN